MYFMICLLVEIDNWCDKYYTKGPVMQMQFLDLLRFLESRQKISKISINNEVIQKLKYLRKKKKK